MKVVQAICVFCLILVMGVCSVEAAPAGMETIPHTRHNIGLLDCNEASVSHNYSVFTVWEGDEGQDLNGDGDMTDSMLTYYDVVREQATITNIPIASRPSIDGDTISFRLDSTGTLAFYSIKDETLTDTGVSLSHQWQPKQISGGIITYSKYERDLNGDGYYDPEVCYYDTSQMSETCLGVMGNYPTTSNGIIAYANENVIYYYDISAGTVYDTGLSGNRPVVDNGIIVYRDSTYTLWYYDISADTATVTPLTDFSDWHSISNGIIVVLADEGTYWGDLNGDGDSTDNYILVYYDINTGRLVNTQVQGCCGTDISNGIVVFDTYEPDVNQDLNGDGDIDDCIQQYVNLFGMETIPQTRNNIALVECDEASAGGDYSVFKVYEDEEGQDLNGDGDMNDTLLTYYDLVKKKANITKLSVTGRPSIDGDVIAYKNPDTGTIHYYDIRGKKDHDTGVDGGWFREAKSISSNIIVYTLVERDLDGDGYLDSEICYYDINTQTATCPELKGSSPSVSSGLIAYVDGNVIQYYDIASAMVHNTGLSGNYPVLDNGIIAYRDGAYAAYYNIATNEQRTTPLTGFSSYISISNGKIVVLADERYGWGDLNGDGDSTDYYILMYYDINTGRLVNTQVQGCCGPDISNGVVVFDTYEDDLQQDLNGDGDMRDCVQQFVIITEP